jgi:poly(ADP-ribose) glycohydrolase ARH3
LLEARLGTGAYTDDTEMMIAIAESLVDNSGFDGEDMGNKFVENLNLDRGYGAGTVQALNNIKAGTSWEKAGEHTFGNGSFGNGSAMRIAPIGLFYHTDYGELKEKAKASSLITHAHLLGKLGATMQALAVAYATNQKPNLDFPVQDCLNCLSDSLDLIGTKYEDKLNIIKKFLKNDPSKREVVKELGSDTRSFNSVPTAVYSFLAHPNNFVEAVTYAINLGGDTDTLGAMTGAIAGSYHGLNSIPQKWLDKLENGEKGRDYVIELGEKLFETKYC